MKNISICLFVLFFIAIGCKNNSEIKNEVSTFVKSDSYKNIKTIQKKMTCDEVVKKIIKSSNLDLKNYINYFVQIDEINDNFIKAQVFLKNNLSHNSAKIQIREHTIARLSFDLITSKLYNTTLDPENPIELNFDKSIIKETDIFDLCKSTKNHKEVLETALKYSFLPEISNQNYGKNVHQYDALKSNNNYLKYFMNGDAIPVNSGKNFNSNNYLYLQKVNKSSYKIASNSNSDSELYTVIVIRDNKIISSLEIDLKNKESLNQLDVKKDDIVNLKRKDILNKNAQWKSYRIAGNRKMVEIE